MGMNWTCSRNGSGKERKRISENKPEESRRREDLE
jgi:hypothetical protein